MTTAAPTLEHKATPGPATAVVDTDPGAGDGEVTALAAVTGVRDEVGDIIVPGALRRTLRERNPRLVVGHDWNRLAGRVVEARELMPGDPRLPRTAADGTPWPRQAGALLIKARYLPTREGREQRAIARAFGPDMQYSIGYKVTPTGAKHRGGIRHIHDLDLYEVSPVLHGANRLAVQLDVKSAASGLRNAVAQLTCGGCGRTAGGTTGAVPRGSVWLCPSCCGQVHALTGYLARNAPEALADSITAADAEPDGDDLDGGGDLLPDLDDLYAEPDDQADAEPGNEPDDQAGAVPDPFVRTTPCALCGAGLGQLGDVPADRDVICPDCLGEITDLADQLAADAESGPTAEREYLDAVSAEIPLTMLADGALVAEGTGNGGIGPRAFGPRAGGRARP